MYRFFLALCAFASLFITATPGQDKKSDVPDLLDGIGKGFAEADIGLKIGMLNIKKGHLKLKLDGYEQSRDVLRRWEKIAEKDWATLKQEEKDEFQRFFEIGQRFAKILGPKKMTEEVIPVAAAAFAGKPIPKPTELQQKIIARASKEKDEAKRIALTIRECLRLTAEDDVLLKNAVAKIDQEIMQLKKLLPKSSKKDDKKEKKK